MNGITRWILSIIFVALLALTGCDAADISSTEANQTVSGQQDNRLVTDPSQIQNYEAEIASQEAEDWAALQSQISVEALTAEDKARIDGALNGETTVSFNQGTLSWDGGLLDVNPNMNTIGQGNIAFVVPTLQLSPQAFQSLYEPFVKSPDATSLYAWESMFHWTGHMENRYALSANGAWFNNIVRGAMQGQGVIYELSGSDAVRHQFLFVTRVSANGGPSMPWAVILAENGAPITGYNTGLHEEVFTEKEATRFLGKILQRGYTQVQPSQLPSTITSVWGKDKNPPVIRYWIWSIAYQIELYARMAALSIAEAASALVNWAGSTITTPLFFIVPDCEFFYMPGMCGTIKS